MTCTIDEWAGAATAASIDIAIQVLGLDAAIRFELGEPFTAPFAAYVPLSSSDSHIQLGIVAELPDCERISRTRFRPRRSQWTTPIFSSVARCWFSATKRTSSSSSAAS